MEENTAPKAGINAAIIGIMRKVGAIGKDRKNQQQGYNFRGIDDAMNALHHLFADEGVFITTEVLEQTREERQNKSGGLLIYSILKVRFTFHALDGSMRICEMIGEGMDSGDKASNKSLSVALKYALLQMFLIPTKEFIDPENDNPEPRPRQGAPETTLPKDSYQQVPTVERPATVNPPANTEPSMTKWRDVVAHIGKTTKGKRLGDLSESVLGDMLKYVTGVARKTKADNLLLAALSAWEAEKKPSQTKALFQKLQEEKIDPQVFGDAVRAAGIVDHKHPMDYNEDEADFVLKSWPDCMAALAEETKKGE